MHGTNKRLDAPIGVFGFKIDVKEKDAADWNSLNGVTNKIPLTINGNELPDFNGELLYQVYPSQLDGEFQKKLLASNVLCKLERKKYGNP